LENIVEPDAVLFGVDDVFAGSTPVPAELPGRTATSQPTGMMSNDEQTQWKRRFRPRGDFG
jgi:hypothetical protein